MMRGGCEPLESRRLLFATYVGQGDPNGVWAVTNISYSYSNFQDFAPNWADGLSRVDMQNAIEESMGVWTAVTPLRFFARVDSGPPPSETPYDAGSNPTIRWGHHLIDGNPGGLNTLAHALRPGTGGVNGDPHYDDGNTWTINQIMETGAHEFGHAIGLAHANGNVSGNPPMCPGPGPNGAAVMDACAGSFSFNGLESGFLLQDDILGVRSLYGAGLGYVMDGFGELNVYGTAGNDLLSVDVSGGNITVTSAVIGGAFTGSFTRALNDGQTTVNSIQLHGLDGNDILRFENSGGLRVNGYGGAGDDTLELGVVSRNLNNLGEAQFFAGAGIDRIGVYDNNNGGGQTYTVTSARIDRPGWGGLRYDFSSEGLALTTGNTANIVNVISTFAGQPLTLNSGGGADVVNIGNTNTGVRSIAAAVEVNNSPSFSVVNINNAPDTVARGVESGTSGAFGYVAGLAPATITYRNGDVSAVNVALGSGADVVGIYHTAKPTTFTNAGGSDRVTVGNNANGVQSILGSLTINAAFGANQELTLLDAANTAGRTVSMTAVGIDYSIAGLAPGIIKYRDFGGVTVHEGGGGDSFSFGATLGHRLTVNGNGGNDAFNWQAVNNWGDLIFGPFTFVVTLDGGSGFNSLAVNDAARVHPTGYQLYANRLFSRDPTPFAEGADLVFDNMGAIGVTCNNLPNSFSVFGVSTDIDLGNQVTINLNGGADAALVYPRDAAGNLTINGNIGIIGGTEVDAITIQDTASALPINYAFSNPFGGGTQNLFGLGTQGGLGTALLENITVNAGSGNDTFAVNQYRSGTALTLNGGLGDDVCDFGNGDVAANVTSIASFLFNGMEGTDTFNLRNATPANSFTYTAAANTTLQVARTLPSAYFVSLEYYNTEHKDLYAGPAVDVMNITSFASGELSFHGAGGDDALNLPTNSDLLGRRVNFFGDAGNANRINQVTNGKTTPSTLHVSQNTIGAFPGDDFFAPGGSVLFDSVQVVQLRMGGGADTAYVQPDAVAAISIIGGNPAAAPGDTLNLALASATDYAVNGTPASGSVTSSNLKTLSYSGFETGPNIDDVAPAVIVADVNIDGIPAFADGGARRQSVDVQFSEDASALIAPGSLTLINLTTNEPIPTANVAVEYDLTTNTAHFTFPGYANGVLPDGDYEGRVLAGLPDLFGNGLPSDAAFNFFFMQADANGDRSVNLLDFNRLAANFGNSPRTFSQGDFNYDGTVNLQDFNILASRFGNVIAGDGTLTRTPFSPIPVAAAGKSAKAISLVKRLNEVLG